MLTVPHFCAKLEKKCLSYRTSNSDAGSCRRSSSYQLCQWRLRVKGDQNNSISALLPLRICGKATCTNIVPTFYLLADYVSRYHEVVRPSLMEG